MSRRPSGSTSPPTRPSQIGNNLRTRIAYNSAWSKTEGRLPNQTGSNSTTTLFGIDDITPSWSLSGQADWVVTPTFFVGARLGYYYSDSFNEGVPAEPLYQFTASNNIGLVGTNGVPVPPAYQHPTGYNSIFTNTSSKYDEQTRLNFQIDSTFYFNAGGQHTVKGGFQLDALGNNVLSGEQGNFVRLRWDQALSGVRGAYGYYQVRSNEPYPKLGFITEGDVSVNNYGLFIQDAWTLNNKLTLNLGLRTENEKVPTYTTAEGVPTYAVEFPFSDKLAPRLGFAYDVKGDGRWKVYGSWGIFYDIFKLELPRGSWGGDKWLEYYYSLDTYVFDTLASSQSCPPACPGTLLRGPIDFRHPSLGEGYVEPDLKPMKSQEFSAGFEHQLSPVMALSARYVHKWVTTAIEDIGTVDAEGNELYIIGNPGMGITSLAWSDPLTNLPKAKRDYDSVEFAFTKNFSNNWYLRGSYLWSRLYGNYSGLSQSDENGRTSPNVGRLFDYPIMMFDKTGQPAYGPLGTDRPNQFKAQFIYQFGFGTSVGLNEYVASGIPRTQRDLRHSAEQLPDAVREPRQRWPHADVLADGPEPPARLQARRLQVAPAGTERRQPVQPGHGDELLPDAVRERTGHPVRRDGVLLRQGQLRAARRGGGEGPALPDGQRIPGAHLGALRRPVPVLG